MKKTRWVLLLLMMVLILSGCGENTDNNAKDNALDLAENHSKNEKKNETVEMAVENEDEGPNTDQKDSEAESDEVSNETKEEVVKLRNTSRTKALDDVIKMSINPGESLEFFIKSDTGIAFIEVRSLSNIKTTLREIAIDDNANNSFYLGEEQAFLKRFMPDGDEVLYLENDTEEIITCILAVDYESQEALTKKIEDSQLQLMNKSVNFESGLVLDVEKGTLHLDTVDVFIEDAENELAMMEGSTYLWVKGTIENTSDEAVSMMSLLHFEIKNSDGKQMGDATSWLADGDGYKFLEPGEVGEFQKLFLLKGDRKRLDVTIKSVDSDNLMYTLDIEKVSDTAKMIEETQDEASKTALEDFATEVLNTLGSGHLESMSDLSDYIFIGYKETGDTTSVFIESYMWENLLDQTEEVIFEQVYLTSMTYADFFNRYLIETNLEYIATYTQEEPMSYTWLDHWENDQYLLYQGDGYEVYLMVSGDIDNYRLVGIGIGE